RFVAVGPAGLAVQRGRRRLQRIPWVRIDRARCNLFRKRVDVSLVGGGVVRLGFPYFHGDLVEMDRCARALNSAHPGG
ncbi:MAG: hypothetical protein D6788_04860, partial [Planctomycetota bacterium]